MVARRERRSPPAGARMLTIGALSRATRIPVETLRSWERRYGAPEASRKPSGHRVYADDTVEQLRRVMRLLAHGHRPGEILLLPPDELDSMLALSEPTPLTSRTRSRVETPQGSANGLLERLMRATSRLDREAVTEELRVGWARLGPTRFLDEVAGPFMVEVGRAWGAKALGIRHEHLASACLTDFLRSAREPFDRDATGPRVIAAMLPGDHHEGGLLMAALLLAVHGYRVIFLGRETPIEEIAAAVRDGDVESVAVSVSAAMPRARASAALSRLRKSLPARVTVWLGGAGAPASVRGIERFATLGEFAGRLTPRG